MSDKRPVPLANASIYEIRWVEESFNGISCYCVVRNAMPVDVKRRLGPHRRQICTEVASQWAKQQDRDGDRFRCVVGPALGFEVGVELLEMGGHHDSLGRERTKKQQAQTRCRVKQDWTTYGPRGGGIRYDSPILCAASNSDCLPPIAFRISSLISNFGLVTYCIMDLAAASRRSAGVCTR